MRQDVCTTVHEAKDIEMNFETAEETDVEAFITQYVFNLTDKDSRGNAVTFGEFWRHLLDDADFVVLCLLQCMNVVL